MPHLPCIPLDRPSFPLEWPDLIAAAAAAASAAAAAAASSSARDPNISSSSSTSSSPRRPFPPTDLRTGAHAAASTPPSGMIGASASASGAKPEDSAPKPAVSHHSAPTLHHSHHPPHHASSHAHPHHAHHHAHHHAASVASVANSRPRVLSSLNYGAEFERERVGGVGFESKSDNRGAASCARGNDGGTFRVVVKSQISEVVSVA